MSGVQNVQRSMAEAWLTIGTPLRLLSKAVLPILVAETPLGLVAGEAACFWVKAIAGAGSYTVNEVLVGALRISSITNGDVHRAAIIELQQQTKDQLVPPTFATQWYQAQGVKINANDFKARHFPSKWILAHALEQVQIQQTMLPATQR